jgi:hypothetical protein
MDQHRKYLDVFGAAFVGGKKIMSNNSYLEKTVFKKFKKDLVAKSVAEGDDCCDYRLTKSF